MQVAERFCINSSKITHETIDGEVVIVNLASGSYYSLDGVGATIWRCLEDRPSFAGVVADTTQRFDGEVEELTEAVKKLIEELQAEGLILKEENENQTETLPNASVAPGPSDRSVKAQFIPPLLHKYTDMQDLLLLDPIHDVDEAGWPTVKPGAKKEDGKA
jgi:hypothetical protein